MLTLITGGSGGIGVALAHEMARRGSDLILVARSADALHAAAEKLAAAHRVRTHVIVADLAAPGAAAHVARQTRGIGRIDVLINNAGFGAFGPFADAPLESQMEMVRVNVDVVTELTGLLLPDVMAARGKIMNLASTAAFQPGPLMAVYYATKAYVLSFSEALAEELGERGVTVTCLCPGPTRTEFQARAGVEETRLMKLGLMSAEKVARAGVDGMFAGRRIVVPGLANRLGTQLPRVSPRLLTAKAVKWVQDKGKKGRRIE